jgi:hypothetical protein
MTRDQRRDREAFGIVVSWYCSQCGKAIPIEEERTFEEDRRAHLQRHSGRRGDSYSESPVLLSGKDRLESLFVCRQS